MWWGASLLLLMNGITVPSPPPGEGYILLENEEAILLEDGQGLLLEGSN